MNNLNIIITTFSKRFHLIEPLIKSIKNNFIHNRIILIVNGEYKQNEDTNYIQNILKLSSIYHIIPIIFPEFRSLSKMWNTGCIFANSENILILNDDIYINNNFIENEYPNMQLENIILINNSFSHFLINKTFIEKIGYFDERFIGIGFEDEDIRIRYKNIFNKEIPTYYTQSIKHDTSNIKHDNIINTIWDKYSLTNFNFFKQKYLNYDLSSRQYSQQNIDNINTYPLEIYFNLNKDKL